MLCRRSRFAQAGAAASAQSCAWPSVIGVQDDNRIIPDSAAYYWDQPIVATSSVRITVSGTYPDARYFSLSVYAPYGAPFSQNCVTSSLPDYRIEPSPGASTPGSIERRPVAASR